MRSKIYPLLALFAFANVVELWHGFTHEHVLCLEHSQIEETAHNDEQKNSHKKDTSESAFVTQSSEEEHNSCEYTSSVRQEYIATPNTISLSLGSITPDNSFLTSSHTIDHLFMAPKGSPPQLSMS